MGIRPGDTITSQATGRTLTVMGVMKSVRFNQDGTHGELRVIVRTQNGKDTMVVRERSGPAGITDAQVEAAFLNVEADIVADAKAWVDR